MRVRDLGVCYASDDEYGLYFSTFPAKKSPYSRLNWRGVVLISLELLIVSQLYLSAISSLTHSVDGSDSLPVSKSNRFNISYASDLFRKRQTMRMLEI